MPPGSRRPDRVAEAIREEVATFLAEDVKDPRVVGLVTVTGVEVTRDLRHAKVFVSVMGTDGERAATFQGLDSVAGHLRVARRPRAAVCASRRRSPSGPTRASRTRRASRRSLPRSTTEPAQPAETRTTDGVLLVDKPAGVTSHDVVAVGAPRNA